MHRYIIDASVFIQAKNSYYSFDFCPGFWHLLTDLHEANKILSIDKIKGELLEQNDELSEWASDTLDPEFFKKTESQSVLLKYREIMKYVYSQKQYTDAAKADFARGADGWLIAYACIFKCFLVTHEQLAPDAKKTVPIPNIAHIFNVECKDVFDMLRETGVKMTRSAKKLG